MKLKYDYSVKKRKILIELETCEFTPKELKAIDMLGEPVVKIQKTYPGGFTISLAKKLKSEFKARVRIDGTQDIEAANDAGQRFLADLKEVLERTMEELMDSYEDQIFPPKHGVLSVSEYR